MSQILERNIPVLIWYGRVEKLQSKRLESKDLSDICYIAEVNVKQDVAALRTALPTTPKVLVVHEADEQMILDQLAASQMESSWSRNRHCCKFKHSIEMK